MLFRSCTDGLGESSEEIETGGREPIAANESAVIAKPILDSLVVEDSESNRSLPDPPCTDESEGLKNFREPHNLLDQRISSKAGSRLRREFSWRGATQL